MDFTVYLLLSSFELPAELIEQKGGRLFAQADREIVSTDKSVRLKIVFFIFDAHLPSRERIHIRCFHPNLDESKNGFLGRRPNPSVRQLLEYPSSFDRSICGKKSATEKQRCEGKESNNSSRNEESGCSCHHPARTVRARHSRGRPCAQQRFDLLSENHREKLLTPMRTRSTATHRQERNRERGESPRARIEVAFQIRITSHSQMAAEKKTRKSRSQRAYAAATARAMVREERSSNSRLHAGFLPFHRVASSGSPLSRLLLQSIRSAKPIGPFNGPSSVFELPHFPLPLSQTSAASIHTHSLSHARLHATAAAVHLSTRLLRSKSAGRQLPYSLQLLRTLQRKVAPPACAGKDRMNRHRTAGVFQPQTSSLEEPRHTPPGVEIRAQRRNSSTIRRLAASKEPRFLSGWRSPALSTSCLSSLPPNRRSIPAIARACSRIDGRMSPCAGVGSSFHPSHHLCSLGPKVKHRLAHSSGVRHSFARAGVKTNRSLQNGSRQAKNTQRQEWREAKNLLPAFLYIHGGGVGSLVIAPSTRRRYCMRWQGVDCSSLSSLYHLFLLSFSIPTRYYCTAKPLSSGFGFTRR